MAKNKNFMRDTLLSGTAYLDFKHPCSNEEEKDIELAPCPFCGGEAELSNSTECWGHGMFIKEYYVICKQCGGRSKTSAVYDVPDEVAKATAIDAWNTRGGKQYA